MIQGTHKRGFPILVQIFKKILLSKDKHNFHEIAKDLFRKYYKLTSENSDFSA